MSETSEIVNDCLTHYNQRHIQVRWDFYTLCVYDPSKYNQKVNDKGHVIKDEPNQECMAKILRVIETLTDAKRVQWHIDARNAREKGLTPPQEPKEWPIELAYEAIVELLYHTFGENIVRNSIAVLLERGFLKRYQASSNSIPLYYLNIPFIQAALKKQAEDTLVGVESNTHVKRKKRVLKVTPEDSKVTPEGVENKDLGSESNTNNIDSNNTDNKPKRESTAPESHTPTVSPPDVGNARANSSQSDTQSQQRILTLLCLAEPRATPSVERVVVMAETKEAWQGYPLGQPDHEISMQYLKSGWKVLYEQQGEPHGRTNDDLADLALHGNQHHPGSADCREDGAGKPPVTSKQGRDDRQLEQNTPTTLPAQASPPTSEQAASGRCHFCPEQAELTCRVCGKGVCYDTHGRRFPLSETEVEDYCLPCLEEHNAAVTKALRQKESACGTREAAPQAQAADLAPKGKGKKQAEVKPDFTPEGEMLYQDWCSLFHVKIPRTKAIILAANDLYEPIAYWSGKLDIPRAEVLKRIMNWQYKNNPNYYGEGRGVKLFDVHRDFEEWQSAAQRKLDRALRIVSTDELTPTVSGRPRLDVPPEYLAMMIGARS